MKNYVLLLILCGFSIRTYLSQDSQVLTFYPSQSSSSVISHSPSEDTYGSQPLNRFSQGQYTPTSFQQAPLQVQNQGTDKLHSQIPHQNQYETQPGSGSIHQFANYTVNTNVPNLVRVTYFNSAQQGYTQPVKNYGDVLQIVKQIIRPQSERLIQKIPVSQDIHTVDYNQPVRIQRPGRQFQVPAQQQQGHVYPFSDQTSQVGTLNVPRQEQSPSQYQNYMIPNSEYVQPQDQQIHGIQYQTLPNSDRDNDRYTAFQSKNNAQFPEVQTKGEIPRENSFQYVYPISESPQRVAEERQKDFHQSGESQNYQNSSELMSQPSEPIKKPFYINRFAADLYITRKPCEICCKMDEIRPCSSCCNVTALLNSRTLKTAVG